MVAECTHRGALAMVNAQRGPCGLCLSEWKYMAMFCRGFLAVVAMAGAACQFQLEDPVPPSTADLEAVYDNPPGMFSAGDLQLLRAGFEEQITLLQATGNLGATETLLNVVGASPGVAENGGQAESTPASRVAAVIDVTRVCAGPNGDGPVTGNRYGTVTMTLKGGLRGLFPIAWGEFDACADRTPGGAPFTIDGPYSITLRKRDTGRDVLFLFQGTITAERVNYNGSLDVRVRSDGTPEVRLSGANGDVVVSVDATNGNILARDRTGLWRCDPLKLECVNETTGERKSP